MADEASCGQTLPVCRDGGGEERERGGGGFFPLKRTFKAVFVDYDGVILGGFGQAEELASAEDERGENSVAVCLYLHAHRVPNFMHLQC